LGNNLDAATALTRLTSLAHNIRESANSNEIFSSVAETAAVLIGHRLFTVMTFDAPSMQVQRIYSSDATAYPPGVSKGKRDTQWGRQVLHQGLPYIGRDGKDIKENFSDHEIILNLGLESILNIPIRYHGATLGTMNLLNSADFYAPSDESWGYMLAALLVGPLLSPR
jgi:GAF domain-containing protein